MNHTGAQRLHDTIGQHFFHPSLRVTVTNEVLHCDLCQRVKSPGRGYCHHPPREALLARFDEVHIDLIGPWTIAYHGLELTFHALTCVDPVTNLADTIRIQNKTAAHVATMFENLWLSRYLRPLRCVHDPGSEFIGMAFVAMLNRNGIEAQPTTARNPQANAICERLHQSVGNTIRTLLKIQPLNAPQDATTIIDRCIAKAVQTLRSVVTSATGLSPGAMVFRRDMLLNIPLLVDLATIQENRQRLIDNRLVIANRKRYNHDYQIGDPVLKLAPTPSKLQDRTEGPYPIETVHINGTLTIRLNDRHVTERINIRRVKPYRP